MRKGASKGPSVAPFGTARGRKLGAVKPQLFTVLEKDACGCVYEYPAKAPNGAGLGRPMLANPCEVHSTKHGQNHPKLGGVKSLPPGGLSHNRQCEHCEGERHGGQWVHTPGCRYRVVVWDAFPSKWTCPYGCVGVHLSACRVHVWDCTFWQIEGKGNTPF